MKYTDPVRILHVTGGMNIGGAETAVMNLFRQVDRQIILFDFVSHTEAACSYDEEIETLGGRIYHAPAYKGYNHIRYVKWWKDFWESHPEYPIMHGHVRSVAAIYLSIAKRYGVITISHSHSTSNGHGFISFIKCIFQLPIRYTADYFFACSQIAGEWLFGKKIVNSNKYHILRNAVNTDLFKFDEEIRKKYRKELGIENKTVYCHVGRFHPSKNHTFLLEVFAGLHAKKPDSVLLLIGDGERRETIHAKIRMLGLGSSVMLLGRRTDVPEILQAVDCFVFPSLWEGLPVSAVEAQAAGLPCYISDTITQDIDISPLVHYLPIDQGRNIWVQELEKADLTRIDVSPDIISAGFDVRASAAWLTDFYLGLLSE